MVWRLCLAFPGNGFNFVTQKLQTNWKFFLSKCSEHSFLISKSFQNHFLQSLLWPIMNLNGVEGSLSLSQKMVSTLQKTEKYLFQTLGRNVFELKIASKPFSKKLPLTKFCFKYFLTFLLTFGENVFNFVTQKIAKNWKIPFWNNQNVCFWAQASSKTIF